MKTIKKLQSTFFLSLVNAHSHLLKIINTLALCLLLLLVIYNSLNLLYFFKYVCGC